jgi:hypothetical protein
LVFVLAEEDVDGMPGVIVVDVLLRVETEEATDLLWLDLPAT